MISSLDPFSQAFDSIRVEPAAPEKQAAEAHAFPELDLPATPGLTPLLFEQEDLPTGPKADAAGFYLLDDAGGRFTIDRDTGVVTLVHDHLMTLESGAIHPVHIKVIEHSGESYELHFRLRMTGRIPQLAGGEENDGLASLAAAPLLDLMSPAELAASNPPIHTCRWATFSAVTEGHGMLQRLGSERDIYGALLEPPTFPGFIAETGELTLHTALPRPAKAGAVWLM